MKRLMNLLFVGFIFVFFLSFVSAQISPGSNNDTIFRISSSTNAHGETWNGGGAYGIPILYSDFFGTNNNDLATLRQCTPGAGNLVLRLSGNTNAHAQASGQSPAYPIDICYGDLSCFSSTSACPGGSTEIVSLNSANNAHLEIATANNYNTRICCSVSSTPQILSAKWKYVNGQDILADSVVCPNIFIVASLQTSGIADGTQIDIQVFDKDGVFDDPIGPALPAFVMGNRADVLIDLSNPVIRSFLDPELAEIGEGNRLELRFFNESGFSGRIESQQILYSDNVNDCNYPGPNAVINSPNDGEVYFTNTQINFASGCNSLMGPVNNTWTITQNGNTYTNSSASFSRSFSSAGQVNVKLQCTDLIGRKDSAEVNILVAAGQGVFAFINEPGFNEIVYNTPVSGQPYFPEEVSFSASESYAVSVSSCSVSCAAGNCPSTTENAPSGCPAGPVNISGTPAPYTPMTFDWRFWDSDWTENNAFDGAGNYSGNIQYNDVSNVLNDKYMSVSITYGSESASFERRFTLNGCLNNGNTFYPNSDESYSTTQENGACRGGDSIPGTADDCCPVGHQCTDEGSSTGQFRCKPADNLVLRCEEFTTQELCNGNNNTAIPRASYGSNPPACTFLECYWSSGSCGVRARQYPKNATTGACSFGPGGTGEISDCSWTTTSSECINGRKTITYNSIGATSCPKDPQVVPCGSLSFELSFFGWRQFLLSAILITALYLVFFGINRNDKK